jgi:hypothetical protein
VLKVWCHLTIVVGEPAEKPAKEATNGKGAKAEAKPAKKAAAPKAAKPEAKVEAVAEAPAQQESTESKE